MNDKKDIKIDYSPRSDLPSREKFEDDITPDIKRFNGRAPGLLNCITICFAFCRGRRSAFPTRHTITGSGYTGVPYFIWAR